MPAQQSALSVSLSRHQACRACRTRKIRCDAQRPACAPCVKWAVSRGRDPDAVICSYDGDTPAVVNGDQGPTNGAAPTTTLFLGADILGEAKNQMLEGRVAELETMLAQQSATLAALLPSVAATADPTVPSALTSLIGLPIARASSSSASSPESSGMDGLRPQRASSVASSSGSSVFTNEGQRRRSSLDGAPFPPPSQALSQLTPEMAAAGTSVHGAFGAPAIAYPSLPTVLPATFGQAPLTVTTAVPLGPHSVACNDPNCPDYLRAREAAMRLPQPLSLGPQGMAAFGAAGIRPPMIPAVVSGGDGGPQANAALSNILSDLGFSTGVPSNNAAAASPPESQIQVKMEDMGSALPALPAIPPPPAIPQTLPMPMSMSGMHPLPTSMLDPSAFSLPAIPLPSAAGHPGLPPNMEFSPEVWNMLFSGAEQGPHAGFASA